MATRKLIETGAGTIGAFLPIQYDGKTLSVDQVRAVSDYLTALSTAINGNLSFGTGVGSSHGGNFHSQWVQLVFGLANVEVEIPHGLGRKPTDVWFGVPSGPCRFYTTKRGSWGIPSIWLACDVAGITVPLLIF